MTDTPLFWETCRDLGFLPPNSTRAIAREEVPEVNHSTLPSLAPPPAPRKRTPRRKAISAPSRRLDKEEGK